MSHAIYTPSSNAQKYRIGDWILCIHTNSLCRWNQQPEKETRIELENRLVLLLLFFIDNAHKVLSKDLILSSIWKGKVVNHDSLAVAISHLRKALADDSRSPHYIKTIPGVGYQFIAEAYPLETESQKSKTAINFPDSLINLSNRKAFNHKIIYFMVLVIGIFMALAFWGLHRNDSDLTTSEITRSSPEEYLSVKAAKQFAHIEEQASSQDFSQWLDAINSLRHLLKTYPDYAPGYFQIAELKIKLLGDKLVIKENCAEIIGLLDKALVLDAQLVPAWVRRADIVFWCRHDYAEAEKNYKIAIALDPENDQAPMQYAQLLLSQKRFEESLEQVERARKLNPLNYSVPVVVWIYQMRNRNDLAMRELTRIQSAEPENRYFHISAQRVYAKSNLDNKSFQHLLWLMKDVGYTTTELEEVEKIFTAGKLVAVNHWLLNRQESQDLGQYTPPLSWARYALAAGENEQAIQYLLQAFNARQPQLLWASVDPAYDAVREDKRFQDALEEFMTTNAY